MRRYPGRRSRHRRARFARRFPLSGPAIALMTAAFSFLIIFGFSQRAAKLAEAGDQSVFSEASQTPAPTLTPQAAGISTPAPTPGPVLATYAPTLTPVPAVSETVTTTTSPRVSVTTAGETAGVYVTESERFFIQPDIALQSPYVYLIHAASGGVLLDRGSTQYVYPASMTKVMTALVALEMLESRGVRITVGEDMFGLINERRLSTAGFQPGERITAEDLMYGLILCSGAECAIALAEHLCGTEAAFAEKMNEKAAELGMNDTHFTNAVGYHAEDHYTTLRDMAILFRAAMTQPWYYQISAARTYTSTKTQEHPAGLHLKNTLFVYAENEPESEIRVIAGKTGTTDEAGRCLVSEASVYGQYFICVTAAAQGANQPHITDALAVYNSISIDVSP